MGLRRRLTEAELRIPRSRLQSELLEGEDELMRMRANLALVIGFFTMSCTGTVAPPTNATVPREVSPVSGPKRITAAIMTDPATVFLQMDAGSLPGTDTM